MSGDDVPARAQALSERLHARHLTLVTAESCTGGLIAAAMTEIPASSGIFERGFVTYSNIAKESDLGVSKDLLERHGAVSEPVARTMAEGALARSQADLAVSVTGIAGPGGGTAEKPVGLVYFAASRRGGETLHREMRFGDLGRNEVRRRSVLTAFELLNELLDRG